MWFDGGIEAGSEWPEYIATHLEGAACVVAFISDTFVESHNSKRELKFAQEQQKPLLNVYIEDVELTAGMRMQLGPNIAPAAVAIGVYFGYICFASSKK